MQELTGRDTADNLKEKLENVFIEFEIGKKQIYTITTDNGRNMVKAVELFSTQSAIEIQVGEEDEYLNMGSNIDEQFLEYLEDNLCSEEQNVVSVKCTTHIPQLGVNDFLAENKTETIFKTLRTPKFSCCSNALVTQHWTCYSVCWNIKTFSKRISRNLYYYQKRTD